MSFLKKSISLIQKRNPGRRSIKSKESKVADSKIHAKVTPMRKKSKSRIKSNPLKTRNKY